MAWSFGSLAASEGERDPDEVPFDPSELTPVRDASLRKALSTLAVLPTPTPEELEDLADDADELRTTIALVSLSLFALEVESKRGLLPVARARDFSIGVSEDVESYFWDADAEFLRVPDDERADTTVADALCAQKATRRFMTNVFVGVRRADGTDRSILDVVRASRAKTAPRF